MPDSRSRRLLDWLADVPFRAMLWASDKLAGPMPNTWADEIREARRARLRNAFPGLLPEDESRALAPDWYLGVPCSRCGEMIPVFPDISEGHGALIIDISKRIRERCRCGHLNRFRASEMRRFEWRG